MDLRKLEGLIGLAVRARKCIQGSEACAQGIRTGKVLVLLLDPSASANTRKEFSNLCSNYCCPLVILPEAGWLEKVTGTTNRRVIAFSDPGFGQAILKMKED